MVKNGHKFLGNKQAKQRSPLCAPWGDEINSQISLKKINMAKND